MANEENAEGGDKVDIPSGPGRYFVFVLLILLMEGAVGYWVLDRAVPAPEVPQRESQEEAEKKKEVWKPPIFYEGMKDLVVEPTSVRGKSMVQLSLAIQVDDQAVVDELTLRHTVVWDLILRHLELLKEPDFRDPTKTRLKADLVQVINAELKNPGVVNVFVTDIITQ
jgi:flagellar basal body-associated protein FliL